MSAVVTRVVGCTDPVAYERGLWEVILPGEERDERWYGPDSIRACLEAQRILEPVAQDAAALGGDLRARLHAEITR